MVPSYQKKYTKKAIYLKKRLIISDFPEILMEMLKTSGCKRLQSNTATLCYAW